MTLSDSGDVGGIVNLTVTGDITMSASKLVDGRDISADWTTSSTHFANTTIHLPSSLGTANQQLRVNSGATAPEWFTPSSGAAYLYGNGVPDNSLGNNGDTYERIPTGMLWTKSAGAWSRSGYASGVDDMTGFAFAVMPRYNATNLTHIGGADSSTTAGSSTGVTYATTNARTSHTRIAFNGNTSANSICSGLITPQINIISVSNSTKHGRFNIKFRFGFASVTASNFRFFCGIITTAGTFSDDPTGASSVLGDRIGLAVDANTALAAKWLVNYSGANQLNTAAHTIVQDNFYEMLIYTTPNSNVINFELWEQTTANGSFTLVSSNAFAVTSDIVDMGMRPYCMAANAGVAAASCNMHFGGLMGRAYFSY